MPLFIKKNIKELRKLEFSLGFLKENYYLCRNFTNRRFIFMIIQFSVENFRSIMEPATLSLVASPLKDARVAAEDVMFDIEGMDVSLLKSAVILGANASGKSNVIKALDFFKSYIIDSFK